MAPLLRSRARISLVGLLVVLAGCKGLLGPEGIPDDPLFLDKKPLEARAVMAPPAPLAYTEPTPPPNPYFPADMAKAAGEPPRLVPAAPTGRRGR